MEKNADYKSLGAYCRTTGCVEIIDEYNAGLCQAALAYNDELIASVADKGPISQVSSHPYNWSSVYVSCGVSEEEILRKLTRLKAGVLAQYAKVRDWEQGYADHREQTLGSQEFPEQVVEKVTEQVAEIRKIQYDLRVGNVVAPKISEIRRDQIEQWKLKTGWEGLLKTGDALLDWATRYEYLQKKEKELYALVHSATDLKVIADAQAALLLCIELNSSLGMPPSTRSVAKQGGVPQNQGASDEDAGEVSYGPALVVEKGKHYLPDMSRIRSPEMTFGFGTKNPYSHAYEVQFWGALLPRLQGQWLKTFSDNQKEFLRHPLRPKFRAFEVRQAFREALKQTTVDMSSASTAMTIEVDGITGQDLDTSCPRLDDIDRFRAAGSEAYSQMENTYTSVCLAFGFSKKIYTQSDGSFIFHPDVFTNDVYFGTSDDPRLGLVTALAASEGRIPELGQEAQKVLGR